MSAKKEKRKGVMRKMTEEAQATEVEKVLNQAVDVPGRVQRCQKHAEGLHRGYHEPKVQRSPGHHKKMAGTVLRSNCGVLGDQGGGICPHIEECSAYPIYLALYDLGQKETNPEGKN